MIILMNMEKLFFRFMSKVKTTNLSLIKNISFNNSIP